MVAHTFNASTQKTGCEFLATLVCMSSSSGRDTQGGLVSSSYLENIDKEGKVISQV